MTEIQLDRSSDEPLYRQLRRSIGEAITAGRYQAGDRLPSSRVLSADLAISRNTVNMAYQELVIEGFVESVDRVGYVVHADFGRERHTRPRPERSVSWANHVKPAGPALPHIWKPSNWAEQPYPFVVGQPDVDMFPSRAWSQALRQALRDEHRGPSLHDLVDRDDPLLLEMICRHVLPSRGILAEPNELLITLGSQHGLELLSAAFLDERSTVGVEEPGYPDARHIFARHGAALVTLPVDDQGVQLERRAALNAVFVTPSHQYPTNVTLSATRRQQLIHEARTRDFLIIEDDYDSEFRYVGWPTPCMKGGPSSDRVLYLGSFAKFLAPGLRLGFVVAEAEVIELLRDIRRYALRHAPGLLQRALALMIESGEYMRSVRRLRNSLKRKWTIMDGALQSHWPWPVERPTGGLSYWIEGPDEFDAVTLAEIAFDHGVVIEPGDACYLSRPAPRHPFRLGFAGIRTDAIEPGVRLLASLAQRLP